MLQSTVLRTVALSLRSLAFSCLLLSGAFAAEPVTADPVRFSIEPQPLGSALNEFARQSDRELLFSTEVVEDKEASLVAGVYEPEEALELLLANTGLEYSVTGNETFLVDEAEDPGNSGKMPGRSPVIAAQTSLKQNQATRRTRANNEQEERNRPIEEIIVTGTHIRGLENPASPFLTFDREDIERTGAATTQDLIQSLPQNFTGGPNDDTTGIQFDDADQNFSRGSSINLRGIGADSTLVLINGHRLAPSGRGRFVDISMIPLTAIERVDILIDGASAIYGSDAVGGVVNIILRDDFEGAETRARYGAGDGIDETRLGQSFGTNWSNGNALLTYEHYVRDSLFVTERSFSSFAEPENTLLPKQKRHSALLSVNQDLGDRVKVSADTIYTLREFESQFSNGLPQAAEGETEQLGGTLGAEIRLSDDWIVQAVGTYSKVDLETIGRRLDLMEPPSGGEFSSDLWSIDAIVDGPTFELPGGDVLASFGVHYREENDSRTPDGSSSILPDDLGRSVTAAFGELLFPIVSDENAVAWIERLELSVAARYEDYSDFGSTTNPKLGIVWFPVDDLKLRATYGRSFRAPQLVDQNLDRATTIIFDFTDPAAADGTTLGIFLSGPTGNLNSETADSWTAGFDYEPAAIEGLKVSVTYYSIDYTDRIGSPTGVVEAFFSALGQDERFGPLITRDPSRALVDELLAAPNGRFLNFFGPFDPDDIGVVFNNTIQNFAVTKTSGLDFAVSRTFDTDIGDFNVGLNANYILELTNQILPTADPFDDVDVIFRPVDLTMRGSLTWSNGPFGASLFVNYTDDYTDNRAEPELDVSSWTTVDVGMSYDTGDQPGASLFSNLVFSLSATDLLDTDPPTIQNSIFGYGFDPQNASPLGRLIAFEVAKSW